MYSADFRWYALQMSIKFIWPNVLYKIWVLLLIFYLDNLSVDVSGVLKSPAVIVLLSTCPFMPVKFALYILKCSSVGYIYIYECYIFLSLSLDHYEVSFLFCNSVFFKPVFSDMHIAAPTFLWFPFAQNTFPIPSLSFCMYL